jgi:NADH:ubiquinone oxidoreductase subunit 3 (subunit A)
MNYTDKTYYYSTLITLIVFTLGVVLLFPQVAVLGLGVKILYSIGCLGIAVAGVLFSAQNIAILRSRN